MPFKTGASQFDGSINVDGSIYQWQKLFQATSATPGTGDFLSSDSSGNIRLGGIGYNESVLSFYRQFNLGSGVGSGTGINNLVYNIAIDSSDKIYAVGEFTAYQDVSANRIIRLNLDGTRDTTFDTSTAFDSTTNCLTIDSNNKIYVGGQFNKYKGTDAICLIRLNPDGTIDNTFDTSTAFDNNVYSIVLDEDKIYVGGDFSSYQGSTSNYIIRLNSDSTIDTGFNIGVGFNGTVRYITLDSSDKIYVGGDFTAYQDVSANRIIRLNLDGTRDTTFDIGVGFNAAAVLSLALDSSDRIYVGGVFTKYQDVSANYIIRLNLDGTRDTTFEIGNGFDNIIYSLVVDSSDRIYVGGVFTKYQDVSANYIIRLNLDGTRDTTFDIGNGFNDYVISLALDGDRIYAGGNFTKYQDVSANRIIALSLDGSTGLKNTNITVNQKGLSYGDNYENINTVNDRWLPDKAYVEKHSRAGDFLTKSDGITNLGGDSRNQRILNFIEDFDFSTGFNSIVYSLALDSSDRIYVGGGFTTYQDISANYIIGLNSDGTRDLTFDILNGFNDTVMSIALDSSDRIYAGGYFTTYQDVSANRIIRLNSDGTRDLTFDILNGFNNFIACITLDSTNKVYVGGGFTTYQDVSANRIIRLNSDGTKNTFINTAVIINKQGLSYSDNYSKSNVTNDRWIPDKFYVDNRYIEIDDNYKLLTGANQIIFANVTDSSLSITLPTVLSHGDKIQIVDNIKKSVINNITIKNNGHYIDGVYDNFVIDINGGSILLIYDSLQNNFVITNIEILDANTNPLSNMKVLDGGDSWGATSLDIVDGGDSWGVFFSDNINGSVI